MPLTSKLAYVPEYDGLRALGVFAVVAHHTVPGMLPGSSLAVNLFFVMSGFLITRILVQEFECTGKINITSFYIRRFLRLTPAFWLLLAFYVAAAVVQGGSKEQKHLHAALASGLYFMNWTRALHLGPDGLLGHTWSLAIEEQFYLIFPILLSLLLLFVKRRLLWISLVILLLVSASWRGYLVMSGAAMDRIYNGFDTRAETLLFGCAAAALPLSRILPALRRFCYVPIILLLVCLYLADPTINPHWQWKPVQLFGLSILAVCIAWMLLLIQSRRRERIPILSWQPLVYCGRISYGIFLWQYPIAIFLSGRVPGAVNFVITVFASLAIASLSFFVIERRVSKLRARFRPIYKTPAVQRGDIAAVWTEQKSVA